MEDFSVAKLLGPDRCVRLCRVLPVPVTFGVILGPVANPLCKPMHKGFSVLFVVRAFLLVERDAHGVNSRGAAQDFEFEALRNSEKAKVPTFFEEYLHNMTVPALLLGHHLLSGHRRTASKNAPSNRPCPLPRVLL